MLNLIGGPINMGWYDDIEWKYKGYKCLIEYDVEEDNVKAFHSETTPKGEKVGLYISPYDSKKETVENEVDYHIENKKFKEHRNG